MRWVCTKAHPRFAADLQVTELGVYVEGIMYNALAYTQCGRARLHGARAAHPNSIGLSIVKPEPEGGCITCSSTFG